jgi:hypothetical protein
MLVKSRGIIRVVAVLGYTVPKISLWVEVLLMQILEEFSGRGVCITRILCGFCHSRRHLRVCKSLSVSSSLVELY